MFLKDFSELCALYLILPPLHPWRVRLQHPRILLSTPLMFASNCFKLILGSSFRKKSIQTGLVPKVVLQRKGGGACAYKSKYATQVYSIRNQESRMPSVSLSLSLPLSLKEKKTRKHFTCAMEAYPVKSSSRPLHFPSHHRAHL